jgi:hypothetical protein
LWHSWAAINRRVTCSASSYRRHIDELA